MAAHSDASRPIARALISVSDKTGLAEFAAGLVAFGVEIVSTGGSAKAIAAAGIKVTEVADFTGSAEILDGRVKTLHPKVHGAILARRDAPAHSAEIREHDIRPIDLVVVNLYPFEATVARGADFSTAIENIDIGGPALIRAAAKNHGDVTVVVEPDDYDIVLGEMTAHGGATTAPTRRHLAAKAFARTGAYDAAISRWFAETMDDRLPARLNISGTRKLSLRYGENPHQEAAFYVAGQTRPGVATARQLQGKALSYNNLNDTDAAFELVSEFDPGQAAAVAIIKHANPCGVALDENLADAYRKALAADPVSAFGGIVAVNRALDEAAAAAISEIFTEVVVAPDAEPAAIEIFARKKNLRLLLTGALADPAAPGMNVKSVAGGLLVQSRDNGRVAREAIKVVTRRAPSDEELSDMLFAFTVAKHVKSNAIVYAKRGAVVGIGAGQMSRVDAARIAARKAAEAKEAAGGDDALGTVGSVVASDAFFPFADGLLAAAEAGARAVIQPGGSVRDDEVIAAANEADLAMVFTGMRHFRH